MPPLLMTMPAAPIIIPVTVIVVLTVFVVLLIYHLIRRLVSCPHQKSKYPIHNQDPSKMKSVLPTSPYSIDPSSTASSNSIYFVKGTTAAGGALMYPALASAPSRTPSTGRHGGGHDDSFDERTSSAQDQTFSLDQVDNVIDELGLVQSSPSPLLTHPQEDHALIPRSQSVSPSNGTPYEIEERTTFRQEMSYHRSERQEFITSYNNGAGSGADGHYESDV